MNKKRGWFVPWDRRSAAGPASPWAARRCGRGMFFKDFNEKGLDFLKSLTIRGVTNVTEEVGRFRVGGWPHKGFPEASFFKNEKIKHS
jgi:hypothetical protein